MPGLKIPRQAIPNQLPHYISFSDLHHCQQPQETWLFLPLIPPKSDLFTFNTSTEMQQVQLKGKLTHEGFIKYYPSCERTQGKWKKQKLCQCHQCFQYLYLYDWGSAGKPLRSKGWIPKRNERMVRKPGLNVKPVTYLFTDHWASCHALHLTLLHDTHYVNT